MHQLVLRARLWLLEHHLYGLREATESRMEILVPFTNLATSVADMAAAPKLTKRQRMHKHYCTLQLAHRASHLEHARRTHRKLITTEQKYAELQAQI